MTEGGVLRDSRHSRGSGNPEVWFWLCQVKEYRTIDLARFGYERVRTGEAIRETNCY